MEAFSYEEGVHAHLRTDYPSGADSRNRYASRLALKRAGGGPAANCVPYAGGG
jgi:hypothetical protein